MRFPLVSIWGLHNLSDVHHRYVTMSMECSKVDAHMSSEGSRADAQSMGAQGEDTDVVFPAAQVKKFTDTLREFSESCAEWRKEVEQTFMETNKNQDSSSPILTQLTEMENRYKEVTDRMEEQKLVLKFGRPRYRSCWIRRRDDWRKVIACMPIHR